MPAPVEPAANARVVCEAPAPDEAARIIASGGVVRRVVVLSAPAGDGVCSLVGVIDIIAEAAAAVEPVDPLRV